MHRFPTKKVVKKPNSTKEIVLQCLHYWSREEGAKERQEASQIGPGLLKAAEDMEEECLCMSLPQYSTYLENNARRSTSQYQSMMFGIYTGSNGGGFWKRRKTS